MSSSSSLTVPGPLSRLARLKPFDWYESAVVLIVACVVEICVRRMTLARLTRWLGVRLADGRAPTVSTESRYPRGVATRKLAAVDRVMKRWPFGDTCLRRCLVGGQRLRKLRPVLHIGVRSTDQGVTAHSWLEVAGQSLDPSSGQFLTLTAARAQP